MNPMEVFEGKVDWSAGLQPYLWNSSVVVSKLHPVMGLRVYATMLDLELQGHAKKGSGGTFQPYSGVRTRDEQKALYEDICLRQKRCGMVADYRTNRGPDTEGVIRFGSNHQEQVYQRWGKSFGHALDFANLRQTSTMTTAQLREAWRPLHETAAKYGITWPLNGVGTVLEMWHFEAHPRSKGWVNGPWPKRPGVHRPLYLGFYGGDAAILQAQCAGLLGLKLTPVGSPRVANDVLHDGIVGPVGETLIKRTQQALGRPVTGMWVEADQISFEYAGGKAPTPKPPTEPTTDVDDVLAKTEQYLAAASANVSAVRRALG